MTWTWQEFALVFTAVFVGRAGWELIAWLWRNRGGRS